MYKKIIGLFVCTLLITMVVLPVGGTIDVDKKNDEKSGKNNMAKYPPIVCPYEPGEAIVGFYGPLPFYYQDIAEEIAAKYKLRLRDTNDDLCAVLYDNVDRNTFFALWNDDDVKYVERNYIYELCLEPDDLDWGLQWGPSQIGTPDAWNLTTGSPTVKVAVIDTGIDYNHPDHGNYYYGYDWLNNDNDPIDDNGHGTICAGVIGAVGDNTIGIAGMSWDVSIIAEKVGGPDTSIGAWEAGKGIVDARNKGAKIISMSFGGFCDSDYIHDAVQFAYNQDCLLIAASGNYPSYDSILYPARLSEVIAVGATDQNDDLWYSLNSIDPADSWGSAWGPDQELVAPGAEIYSTMPTYPVYLTNYSGYALNYDYMNGTSLAAPHVAGVAALIQNINPGLTNEEIRCILRETAEDLYSPGWDEYFGYGLVDAYEAVSSADFRYSIDVNPTSQTIPGGGTAQFTVDVNLLQGTAQPVYLDFDPYYYSPSSPTLYEFVPSYGDPPFSSNLTVNFSGEISWPAFIMRVKGNSGVVNCNLQCHSNFFTVVNSQLPEDLIWIKTSDTDDPNVLNPRNGDIWKSPWIWSDPDPPVLGSYNTLYVTVGNHGLNNTGQVLVQPWHNEYPFTIPIKDFSTILPPQTIYDIPPGGEETVCWEDWYLPSGWPEHFCVFAQAWRPGIEDYDGTFDIQGYNNIAQKNFWAVDTSSPYTSIFKFKNPTAKPMKIMVNMKAPNTDWVVDLCQPSKERKGIVQTPLIVPPREEKNLQFTIIPEERAEEGQVDIWYTIDGYEKIYKDLFKFTFDVNPSGEIEPDMYNNKYFSSLYPAAIPQKYSEYIHRLMKAPFCQASTPLSVIDFPVFI